MTASTPPFDHQCFHESPAKCPCNTRQRKSLLVRGTRSWRLDEPVIARIIMNSTVAQEAVYEETLALGRLGRLEEARSLCAANPNSAAAHSDHGNALFDLGRF